MNINNTNDNENITHMLVSKFSDLLINYEFDPSPFINLNQLDDEQAHAFTPFDYVISIGNHRQVYVVQKQHHNITELQSQLTITQFMSEHDEIVFANDSLLPYLPVLTMTVPFSVIKKFVDGQCVDSNSIPLKYFDSEHYHSFKNATRNILISYLKTEKKIKKVSNDIIDTILLRILYHFALLQIVFYLVALIPSNVLSETNSLIDNCVNKLSCIFNTNSNVSMETMINDYQKNIIDMLTLYNHQFKCSITFLIKLRNTLEKECEESEESPIIASVISSCVQDMKRRYSYIVNSHLMSTLYLLPLEAVKTSSSVSKGNIRQYHLERLLNLLTTCSEVTELIGFRHIHTTCFDANIQTLKTAINITSNEHQPEQIAIKAYFSNRDIIKHVETGCHYCQLIQWFIISTLEFQFNNKNDTKWRNNLKNSISKTCDVEYEMEVNKLNLSAIKTSIEDIAEVEGVTNCNDPNCKGCISRLMFSSNNYLNVLKQLKKKHPDSSSILKLLKHSNKLLLKSNKNVLVKKQNKSTLVIDNKKKKINEETTKQNCKVSEPTGIAPSKKKVIVDNTKKSKKSRKNNSHHNDDEKKQIFENDIKTTKKQATNENNINETKKKNPLVTKPKKKRLDLSTDVKQQLSHLFKTLGEENKYCNVDTHTLKLLYSMTESDRQTPYLWLYSSSIEILQNIFQSITFPNMLKRYGDISTSQYSMIPMYHMKSKQFGWLVCFRRYEQARKCMDMFENYSWSKDNHFISSTFIKHVPSFEIIEFPPKIQIIVQDMYSNYFKRPYESVRSKDIKKWFDDIYFKQKFEQIKEEEQEQKILSRKQEQEQEEGNDVQLFNDYEEKEQEEIEEDSIYPTSIIENKDTFFSYFSTSVPDITLGNDNDEKQQQFKILDFDTNRNKNNVNLPIVQLFSNSTFFFAS